MSDLVVTSFNNQFQADEVLITLSKLQKEHLIDLEDAAVVVKKENGSVKVKQAHNLVASGALSGGFWGLLFGTLFFAPLIGVAAGATAGALSGVAADIGIDDRFIKELGETIENGSSALFILVRRATPDRVVDELQPFKGKILRTSLSKEDENELRKALENPELVPA